MTDVFATIGAALSEFWSGREAVVLFNRYGGTGGALTDELTAAGARVTGIVSGGGGGAPGTPGHPPVWDCAPEGPPLQHRALDDYLAAPPAGFAAWLDAVDPGRTATVLGTTFTEAREVLGRPVHGRRRARWAAWEDKTRVDGLWARTGVPAPPSVVLDADDPAVPAEARRLDRGAGTVLAMDSSAAYLGDSHGLRWVRTPADLDAALGQFTGRTRRLRISAFVPGTPCSVLGMVLDDGVAVFDPIEIVTLADTAGGGLTFCGSSTRWRPGDDAVREMRGCASRAGAWLAREAGFRGIFSLDGIVAPGGTGFVATEVNPRHASGLGLRAGRPDFPLYLFQRAVQEKEPRLPAVPAAEVEEAFRDVVRAHPSHALTLPLPPGAAGGDGPRKVVADGLPHRVECTVRGGALRIGAVSPAPRGGLMGPVLAALARSHGVPGTVSFSSPERAVPAAAPRRSEVRA